MKHFIGTRFNLKTETWISTKAGRAVLTEEWLLHRFSIFEKYCFPSVINQSNLEFDWCIFFDTKTPLLIKKKIEIITEEFPFIHTIFIDKMEDLVGAFKDFIIENSRGDSHIITTRLDNDDIIHRDFVKIIQSLYRPSDLCVIDLRRGFQLSIDVVPPDVRNYRNPYNAFLSVIEPANSFYTVYSRQHQSWKNEKTIFYKKQSLWVELIHEENYLNDRQIKLKRVYSFDHTYFSLSDQFDIDIYRVFIENLLIDIMKFKVFILSIWRIIKKIPIISNRRGFNH